MLGILWFFLWQSAGITASFYCFPEKRTAVRLWLGSVIGTLLSMWAPIPFAFFRGFGITAHIAAAIFGAALHVLWLAPRRKEALCPEDAKIDRPLPFLLVPFMILAVFLVWSHTLQNMDGALYTGQCTYGDMAMHLSFITSIAGQQTFPPEYNLLPGTPVSYPFLCDSVSSSLYLLGTPLRWAYMIPMFFAFAQVFCGVWFLAREFCRRKYAPVLAFLLFFLNGGLGMIYFLNGEYSLHDLFTAFYKTPTNLTEKGMRWVNVIADMLLPQRAFWLGGAVRCFVSPFPGGISRRCAAVSPGGDSRRPSADGTHAFLLWSRPDGGVLAYLFSRARPPFPRMAPWLAPVWSSGCAVGAAAALPLDVPLCRRK